MSLEEGIAETLRLKLGDTLTFDIAGTPVTATRHEPAQGRLGQLPRRISSRCSRPACSTRCRRPTSPRPRAPNGNRGVAVAAACANIRTCWRSTSARSCARCRRSSSRWRARSSSCSCSRLLGGLLVLQAAIAATQDERRFDAAILRTLGASRSASSPPRRSPSSCAGRARRACWRRRARPRSATCCPTACSRFRSTANPLVWLYGIGGGALGVTLAGWLGTRGTLRQPPLAVIRQLA